MTFESWWGEYTYDWRTDIKGEHQPTAEHAYAAGFAAAQEQAARIAGCLAIEASGANSSGELSNRHDNWRHGRSDAQEQIAEAIRGMSHDI